jgi:hypothetical protein
MNKTAIEQLISVVEMDYENGVEISMRVFHKMLLKALEIEKKQKIEFTEQILKDLLKEYKIGKFTFYEKFKDGSKFKTIDEIILNKIKELKNENTTHLEQINEPKYSYKQMQMCWLQSKEFYHLRSEIGFDKFIETLNK